MNNNPKAEQVVIEVMRHFGFRRNYQVAEYFDVTPQTLSGWIKTGEIPPKHLIKYKSEVLDPQNKRKRIQSSESVDVKDSIINNFEKTNKFSWYKTKLVLKKNIKILLGIQLSIVFSTIIYVFLIANPIYTSISKVLPISEDRSSSNGFSGMAAQLGINIPLNIGGTVPWDEIQELSEPEVVAITNPT